MLCRIVLFSLLILVASTASAQDNPPANKVPAQRTIAAGLRFGEVFGLEIDKHISDDLAYPAESMEWPRSTISEDREWGS